MTNIIRGFNSGTYKAHDRKFNNDLAPVDKVIGEPTRRDRWSEEHDLFDLEQSSLFSRRGRHIARPF